MIDRIVGNLIEIIVDMMLSGCDRETMLNGSWVHSVSYEVVAVRRGDVTFVHLVVLIVVFTIQPILIIIHLWHKREVVEDVLSYDFVRTRVDAFQNFCVKGFESVGSQVIIFA